MQPASTWNDTIVALATPPGIGAIAVIRLSGTQALEVVQKLFPARQLASQPSHSILIGMLREGEQPLDEVVLSIFRNPRSYTGEDVVEISCHGSPFIQQQILEACVRQGARIAKPGEFTQRAFLNGKLDLAQAEAVADLIASNTAASRNTALRAMRGGFSAQLSALRERLIRFSALIELELDFSQEDVEFADRGQLYALVEEIHRTTAQLVQSFQLGNVIRQGVSVAIIGKPNAGKSTLLNALLNEERAIVSDIPGTTRDTIEELINIDGIMFRLIDTAGIRRHTTDVIEAAGVERSLEKMRQADLVLILFDVNDPDPGLDQWIHLCRTEAGRENFLLVGNKIDLAAEADLHQRFAAYDRVVFLSARAGEHMQVLRERMVDTVLAGTAQPSDVLVTNARHYHALNEVEKSLRDIRTGLDQHLPGDLLAPDIRRCLHYLGEITGEVSNEDMLDYIFSKFCIGK